MDGRTRYSKISKLLESYVGEKLSVGSLRRIVMMNIGSSEKVVYDTINLMRELGMIREVEAGLFEVNNG